MKYLNRYIIDYEYGGNASKVHGVAIKYEDETKLSEKMRTIWPRVVEEYGL